MQEFVWTPEPSDDAARAIDAAKHEDGIVRARARAFEKLRELPLPIAIATTVRALIAGIEDAERRMREDGHTLDITGVKGLLAAYAISSLAQMEYEG